MTPLTILVDASILKPRLGGIRTYTLSLLRALGPAPGVKLHVATSMPEELAGVAATVVPLPTRTRSFAGRGMWRETSLPGLVRTTGADVVLTPFPEHSARRLPVPSVMVVYDVGPLVAPAYFGRAKRMRFSAALPRACRDATRVVCVSNATLAALHAATGTDPGKCHVIGAAVAAGEEGPHRSPGPERPYVLYVGTMLRHKNVPTLVRAFEGDLPFDLVLAGPCSSDERAGLESLVSTMGLGNRVRHLGWVDEEQLATLYADALAVVVPSLHEGYGLPALEAMALGAPVVASDIPALREVGGDAVAYVTEPLRAVAWRRALEEVHADPALRAALADRGRREARRHTWHGVADAYLSLMRSLTS